MKKILFICFWVVIFIFAVPKSSAVAQSNTGCTDISQCPHGTSCQFGLCRYGFCPNLTTQPDVCTDAELAVCNNLSVYPCLGAQPEGNCRCVPFAECNCETYCTIPSTPDIPTCTNNVCTSAIASCHSQWLCDTPQPSTIPTAQCGTPCQDDIECPQPSPGTSLTLIANPQVCSACLPSFSNPSVSTCQYPQNTPSPTPTTIPTATPFPQCGQICNPYTLGNTCAGAIPTPPANNCSACLPAPTTPITPGQPTPTPKYICQPIQPSPTPTPSTPLACNQPCNPSNNKCPVQGVPPGGGCPVCVPNPANPTTGTCQPALQCNSPCDPAINRCPVQDGQPPVECSICVPNPTNPTLGNCQPPLQCNSPCKVNQNRCPNEPGSPGGQTCSVCVPNTPGSNDGTCKPPLQCNSPCDPANNHCPVLPDALGHSCATCIANPNNPTTGTCQPALQCNSPCDPAINRCPVQDGQPPVECSICVPNPTNPTLGNCQPPLQCNSPCKVNQNRCPNEPGSPGGQTCSVCVPNTPGSNEGTCKPPSPTSTATPTPRPPACNEECNPYNNQCPQGTPDKPNCSSCIPSPDGKSRCQPPPPTSTPVPTLTPRPTPICDCDSIDYQIAGQSVNTELFAGGQQVTFTAYAKFTDSPQAELKQMAFHLQKMNDQGVWSDYFLPHVVPPPPIAGPTIVQQSNPLIERYAATWTLTMPDLTDGRYRVIVPRTASDFVCGYKQSVSNQLTTNNLQLTTNNSQPTTFFGRILAFFERLMGVNQTNSTANTQSIISPNQVTVVAPSGKDSRGLQLGTFDLTHPPSPTPQIYRHCTDVEWVIPKK